MILVRFYMQLKIYNSMTLAQDRKSKITQFCIAYPIVMATFSVFQSNINIYLPFGRYYITSFQYFKESLMCMSTRK